jgi:hypothetical protein
VKTGGKYSKLIGAIVGGVAGIVAAALVTFVGVEVSVDQVAGFLAPLGSILGTYFARPNGG